MKKILIVLGIFMSAQMLGAQYKAVFFDYGNVLVDINFSYVTSFLEKTLSIAHDNALLMIKNARLGYLDEVGIDYWVSRFDEHGQKYEKFSGDFDLEIAKSFARHRNECVYNLAFKLKGHGYQIGIFSNISEHIARIIDREGMYKNFDHVVLSFQIGSEKPHKSSYERLLKRTSFKNSEIVFIDDRPNNVEAAKKHGIEAVKFEECNALEKKMTTLLGLSAHKRD